jgi:hypothetical protein
VPDMSAAAGSPPGLRSLPGIRRFSTGDGRAQSRRGQLSPEATVSFAAERDAAGIDDVFVALDRELIGLVPVKKRIQEIGSLLLVDRVRQRFGLAAPA